MFAILFESTYSVYMEINKLEFDKQAERKSELTRIFGEGATRLVVQISNDNPELNESEVVEYAWSLIPEATAYMLPAEPEDITENAINIYKAYRGVQE